MHVVAYHGELGPSESLPRLCCLLRGAAGSKRGTSVIPYRQAVHMFRYVASRGCIPSMLPSRMDTWHQRCAKLGMRCLRHLCHVGCCAGRLLGQGSSLKVCSVLLASLALLPPPLGAALPLMRI